MGSIQLGFSTVPLSRFEHGVHQVSAPPLGLTERSLNQRSEGRNCIHSLAPSIACTYLEKRKCLIVRRTWGGTV